MVTMDCLKECRLLVLTSDGLQTLFLSISSAIFKGSEQGSHFNGEETEAWRYPDGTLLYSGG